VRVSRGWTLDRYVLREVALPAVAALGLLFQLLISLQLLRRTDVLLGRGIRPRELLLLLANLTPHYLILAAPAALLIGILVGLGRLAEDHESDALWACGVSPLRVALAPLLLALLTGLSMLALELGPEPAGLRAVRQRMDEVLKRAVQQDVKPGVFYEEVSGLTLFAEGVDEATGDWHHVLVHDERDPRAPLLILGRAGRVVPSPGRQALKLDLTDGESHRQDAQAGDYFKLRFQDAVITVDVADSLLRRNTFRSPDDEQPLWEVAAQAREHRSQRAAWRLISTALYRRLSLPLSALALALLGIPLALRASSSQNARARGYLFALLAIAGYYILQRLGVALGVDGRLPPFLAGQLANLCFGTAGVLSFWNLAVRR
jgi:lipopolysaccharide export system permease protein